MKTDYDTVIDAMTRRKALNELLRLVQEPTQEMRLESQSIHSMIAGIDYWIVDRAAKEVGL